MKLKSFLPVIVLLFAFLSLQAQENAKKYYRDGQKSFKKGLFAASIDNFAKAIEIDENYSNAYFYRAQAYSYINQPEKAIEDFDAVNILSPDNTDAWLSNGNLNFDIEDYEKAAEKFANYLADKKKDLEIYGKQIKALSKIEEWQKALNYAKLSLQVKDLPETYFTIGDLEFILENYIGAEMSFRSVLEENPVNINARNYLAKSLYKQGRYDEAISEANTVMVSVGKDKTAFLTRVYSYHKKSDYPQAIKEVSKIIEFYNTDADILDVINYRGDLYLEYSQHIYAIADYSYVINQDFENIYALFKRAKAYEEIIRIDAAILDYDKIVNLGEHKEIAGKYLTETKSRLFELRKENNNPIITISSDNFSEDEIYVAFNRNELEILITVQEESCIKDISVFGGEIINKYSADGKYFVLLNSSGDYEYNATLDLANNEQFSVTAEDVYGNSSTANFSVKRVENNPPDISFIIPYTDESNQVFKVNEEAVIVFEGHINDQSLIKAITFNGANIWFNNEAKNPEFLTSMDITGLDKISIEVTDIYDNKLFKEYYLNRDSISPINNYPMGKTWAVFIENSDYDYFDFVKDSEQDFYLMKAALENYRIDYIIYKKDLTKDQTERFFSIELRDKLKRHGVNSLLIWYAGHGRVLNETGYWIPIDAEPTDEFSYYNLNNLKASMQVYGSDILHTLVITDACGFGPFFSQPILSDFEIISCKDESPAEFKSAQVFSCGGNGIASDAWFAKIFADLLINEQRECIPVEAIVLKVTETMMTENLQSPQFGRVFDFGDENGTFFFIKKPIKIIAELVEE